MPNTKRNNTSKKSTVSTEKPKITITMTPSTSKKTTPRAPFQEPLPTSPSPKPEAPPPTPWETLKITETEYKTMMERTAKRMEEWRKQAVQDYLVDEWDSASYWEQRMDFLERSRWQFNKMRAWSAEVIEQVDAIDEAIQECMDRLDEIWEYQDRLEAEYD